MPEQTENKRRRRSAWSKAVKIAMIQRDWDMGDLAKAIGKSREYTSAVVNERVRSPSSAQAVSDVLNVRNDAYSNWRLE